MVSSNLKLEIALLDEHLKVKKLPTEAENVAESLLNDGRIERELLIPF